MRTNADNKTSLLTLPPEIRLQIYRNLLPCPCEPNEKRPVLQIWTWARKQTPPPVAIQPSCPIPHTFNPLPIRGQLQHWTVSHDTSSWMSYGSLAWSSDQSEYTLAPLLLTCKQTYIEYQPYYWSACSTKLNTLGRYTLDGVSLLDAILAQQVKQYVGGVSFNYSLSPSVGSKVAGQSIGTSPQSNSTLQTSDWKTVCDLLYQMLPGLRRVTVTLSGDIGILMQPEARRDFLEPLMGQSMLSSIVVQWRYCGLLMEEAVVKALVGEGGRLVIDNAAHAMWTTIDMRV